MKKNQPVRSQEGFIVMVRGLHQELLEEDFREFLQDIAPLLDCKINREASTGLIKGYCFALYADLAAAEKAIAKINGSTYMEKTLEAAWALKPEPAGKK